MANATHKVRILVFGIFLLICHTHPAWPATDRPKMSLPTTLWIGYSHEYPYIYLEDEGVVRLNDDWSVDEDLHYRIKIQKDVGKEMGEQKIYYNKSREEILEIKAQVETPDGKVHPYTQIQDFPVYQGSPLYSDLMVKVITLPQVNKGSIIDVKLKSKIKYNLIKDQFYDLEFYPSSPHKHYKTTYVFPKDKNIKVKEYKMLFPPVKTETKSEVAYSFEYHNSGDLDNVERFLPPYHEVFGVTTFSSMESWQTIADWYRELIKKNTIDIPEITQKTAELTASKETQKEKALAILEFLQDNLRYVSLSFGDNTVEPHPTDTIFNNRYGDCKDWSLLAKQMLNLAGITANIVLYQDELGGDPLDEMPSLRAFDHVILEITIDGKKYFVDPQLKNFDIGEFPEGYNNATVLVIEDGSYRFATVPVASGEGTVNDIRIFIQPDPDGGAMYGVKAKLSTDLSNYLRAAWENVPEMERDNFIYKILSPFTQGQKITSPKLNGITGKYGPVTLTCKLNMPYAYQMTNNMMILKEPVDQFFPNPFEEPQRYFPIFIPFNSLTKIKITYSIPEGMKVDYLPEDFEFNNGLMQLGRKMRSKDNAVVAVYAFGMSRGTLPVNKYPEMQSLWNDYYRKSKNAIILKRVK